VQLSWMYSTSVLRLILNIFEYLQLNLIKGKLNQPKFTPILNINMFSHSENEHSFVWL